ncbi:reverse transcriptase domain-containing protein [Halorubrum sp. DTA98]|uniref:reverse transcriptase domain-containing protein n=1 Tax=Halorubrum sp. DTA98 TaxID=3402163 RepID=UPI003AAABE07
MELEVSSDLNLELAWRKSKRDLNHYMNSFARIPHIIEILDSKEDEWLEDLSLRLDGSEDRVYTPRSPRIIDVPKSDYHLRPAHILTVEDLVVYSALMLELYDDIQDEISWSAGNRRFSHILYENVSKDNRWQDFEREYWREMQEEKIELSGEYKYVVETDISGFYENIDIERSISVIRQITEEESVAHNLWELLDFWSQPRKRGLPQGYGASDIIAEVYLDSIDQRLSNHGIDHVRFNDDFTIFTNNRDEAIDTQNLLEKWFRAKGLNMKTGKTAIREANEAKEDYNEPESVFQDIRDDLQTAPKKKAEEIPVSATPYGSGESEAVVQTDNTGNDNLESEVEGQEFEEDVLKRAYREYIQEYEFDQLENHLFRYIINRLGNNDSSIAVDYCRQYIREGRSDVRRIIYNYYDDLSNKDEIANDLAQDITENNLRYPYHEYILIRWFFESNFESDAILHAARQILNEHESSLLETRDYAIAILGEHGDYSDWEQIELIYDGEFRPSSKSILIYSLRKFEPVHRSNFYDRVDISDKITELSIGAAKSKSD